MFNVRGYKEGKTLENDMGEYLKVCIQFVMQNCGTNFINVSQAMLYGETHVTVLHKKCLHDYIPPLFMWIDYKHSDLNILTFPHLFLLVNKKKLWYRLCK